MKSDFNARHFMEKAVEVLVNLCCVWEEHAEPGVEHLHVNTLRQDG